MTTREKLARLEAHARKVIGQMPFLHRAVATAMLENFLSIVADLVNEVEQLKGREDADRRT